MRAEVAQFVRRLDPRLKLVLSFVLGPTLWLLPAAWVCGCALVLFCVLWGLSLSQLFGRKMIQSMMMFVLFWVMLKIGLDFITGLPLLSVLWDGVELGLRLSALLMLGMCLALSSSAHALGMAVSWFLAPVIGRERAWRIALSLALMIHFLPLCLETMTRVKAIVQARSVEGAFARIRIVAQASIRTMGQKTWNQTLVVAGRGLERAEAWQPEFNWTRADSVVASIAVLFAVLFRFLS